MVTFVFSIFFSEKKNIVFFILKYLHTGISCFVSSKNIFTSNGMFLKEDENIFYFFGVHFFTKLIISHFNHHTIIYFWNMAIKT